MERKKILIVEDEQIIAEDIRQTLEANQFAVPAIAVSGTEALQLVAEHKPDLVIMDIILQGEMDGFASAAQIEKSFHVPVIFLSALSLNQLKGRPEIDEPFRYILKPFKERELLTSIRSAFYREIMEKKNSELEFRFQLMADKIEEGILILDNSGCVRFVNQAVIEILGGRKEDYLGETFSYPWQAETAVLEIQHRDKGLLQLELTAQEFNWQGNIWTLLNMRDKTASRWQATQHRHRNNIMQEIFKLSQVGNFRLSYGEDPVILEANSVMINLFDFDHYQDIINLRIQDLLLKPEEYAKILKLFKGEDSFHSQGLFFKTQKGKIFEGNLYLLNMIENNTQDKYREGWLYQTSS
ncbi:MAG: response regulator [Candidatus Cloacimonetes bacterium]|nr:response regulator [Candidatus Cloacimonadota bacterium]